MCEYALTPQQAASSEVKDLLQDWEKYADIDHADAFYREVCSEKLLKQNSIRAGLLLHNRSSLA